MIHEQDGDQHCRGIADSYPGKAKYLVRQSLMNIEANDLPGNRRFGRCMLVCVLKRLDFYSRQNDDETNMQRVRKEYTQRNGLALPDEVLNADITTI